ncbi:MAG: hypothetical protein AB7O37_17225 [Vicinamibacteria bacterium]
MLAFLTLTLVLAANPGQAAVADGAGRAAEESLLAAARADLEARVQELGLSGAAPLVGMDERVIQGAAQASSQPAPSPGVQEKAGL